MARRHTDASSDFEGRYENLHHFLGQETPVTTLSSCSLGLLLGFVLWCILRLLRVCLLSGQDDALHICDFNSCSAGQENLN